MSKKNKDGLIPGQEVNEKTYNETINKQRSQKKAVANEKKIRKNDKPESAIL